MSSRRELPPRRWRRRTVSLDVVYRSSEGSGSARATTLGAGGLFVRVAEAPSEGSSIQVRLRLPGSPRIFEVRGRVAWVLPPAEAGPHAAGMGIAFSDPQEIADLARALEDHPADDELGRRSA